MAVLTQFCRTPARHEMAQDRSLAWLAAAHAHSDPRLDRERFERALRRCACPPDKIGRRGHSIDGVETARFDSGIYDLASSPRGQGSEARTRRFAELADAYFASAYAADADGPDDLIHVTCTGYASPSAAQRLVAQRGWSTRVTHAYHMGCYAALPALRIARGFVATGAATVDLVHTELCSLHLDPSDHSLEQLVVQSLFADGLIRYRMVPDGPGLAVLALHEQVLPDTAGAMTWIVGDTGMKMTLSREVPERIAGALRGFVLELLRAGGREPADLERSVLAVHPGGPRILDRVRDVLELAEDQLAASRAVLFDHGNMSSATLPHVWQRIAADPAIPPGTLVPSLAFGPGLTVCGGLLEKR